MVGGLKLAVWIGPRVCRAACNVNRAGRDEREEHVLIHREIVLAFVELTSVDAEPVRETVELGHRLAVLPAPQRRAAAAGLCRDGQRKPFILGSRPKRGLAHLGVAHDGHPIGIDAVVGLEVVERTHASPCVGREHAPLVRLGEALSVTKEQLVDTPAERNLVVAYKVAVVDGNVGVALVGQQAKRHPVTEMSLAA